MKKFVSVMILSLSMLLTMGCHRKEKTNFEKATDVINNFSVQNTNGFDYSLKQYLNTDVTNSHEIVLRADFSNEIKAKKVESTKKLNDFRENEQFTEETKTTYFYSNRMAELNEDTWKWTTCKEADYFNCGIENFKFDADYFENINEKTQDSYSFKATIIQSKINDFLGIETKSINSVTVNITIDLTLTKLISLKINYFQNTTYTEFSFVPYFGEANIDLPN